MAPKIKLTYFDIKGRAEPIRLTLVAGGVDFEDERIAAPEFMERKTSGKLIFRSLPVMEVDGEMFGESGAMLRYAANIAGLAPTCPLNVCKVDMVIDACETLIGIVSEDSSPKGRTKFAEVELPRYFGPIESLLAKSDGPYLLGKEISAADIKLAVMVDVLKEGYEHIPTDCADKFTAICAMHKAVMEHEKIKNHYASEER